MLAECDVTRTTDMNNTGTVFLDPDQKSPRAQDFEERLTARIVGQERAVRRMSGLYQIFLAGMNPPNRPIGTMLFLGPTGSGKTRVIEAAAEVLYGDPNAVVKIDCAEFQHSHEIAKLIGSPPGYLGHRETSPMLTQENLDRMHTDDMKVSLVLFDEIEKASDSLWQLLLGILDKATLTLGDNRRVDFSKSMVIMTSNLGAREMSELISGGIGFAPGKGTKTPNDTEVDQKIYRTAVEAARRKFSTDPRSRIAGCSGSHHAVSRNQVCLSMFRDGERHADEGRTGLQVRCSSLEESCRAVPCLSAFEPGRDWSDRTGRSRSRGRRRNP
jgi:ATP-dependent Clp protease ATP-binding subunit ClpA